MADNGDLEYFRDTMLAMNTLRTENIPGDFSVNVRGQEITAHKPVLAASSPYFKAMITMDCKESRESRVEIEHLEFSNVKSVIDYLYTRKIDINNENVLSLLDTASFMQICSLEQKCGSHLAENINIFNCIDFLNIAAKFSLEEFVRVSKDFIFKNFAKLGNEQIVKLSLEQILDVAQSENLFLNSEYELFEASKLWACHNNREENFLELLERIRWPQMSLNNFMKANDDPMIQSREECKNYMTKIKRLCFFPYDTSDIDTTKNGRLFHARDCLPTYIYYFGEGRPTRRYDPIEVKWISTDMPTIPYEKFALTAWNNAIYFVGRTPGISQATGGYETTNRVVCYNYHCNMFTSIPSPKFVRRGLGLTTVRGCPFIVGGSSAPTSSGKVPAVPSELFCPQTDEWIECPGPLIPRHSCGVASLADNVYVIGGKSGRLILSSVERFKEGVGWEKVSPMRTKRNSFGCTTFKGHIYVVGGDDGTDRLSSGERYDPQEDKWEPIAPLSRSRRYISLVVVGDKICAVGGRSQEWDPDDPEEYWSDMVESYDPVEDRWDSPRPKGLLGYYGSVVAIKGLKL